MREREHSMHKTSEGVCLLHVSLQKNWEEMHCLSHLSECCILGQWTTGGDDTNKQETHYSF